MGESGTPRGCRLLPEWFKRLLLDDDGTCEGCCFGFVGIIMAGIVVLACIALILLLLIAQGIWAPYG